MWERARKWEKEAWMTHFFFMFSSSKYQIEIEDRKQRNGRQCSVEDAFQWARKWQTERQITETNTNRYIHPTEPNHPGQLATGPECRESISTHSDWELRLVSFIVSCSLMKVRCRSARSRRLLRAGVTPASASGGIKVRGQRSRVKCHRHCQY